MRQRLNAVRQARRDNPARTAIVSDNEVEESVPGQSVLDTAGASGTLQTSVNAGHGPATCRHEPAASFRKQ